MSITTGPRAVASGYDRPRTNTAPHPFPGGPADDPFIRRIADPLGDERRRQSIRDIMHGLKILEEQRDRAIEADEYYDGDVGMVFASQQVRKLLVRQGVNEEEIEDFNYARIPVDVVADALQVAAVKAVPEEDEDDDEEEVDEATQKAREKTAKRAERVLKKLRKVNQLDAEEKSLHKSVSKHGDAFLFVWPVEDARGRVVSVDMRVNTAHNVAFVYDAEDPLKVSYVIKSWTTEVGGDDLTPERRGSKSAVRVNLYYPGTVEPQPIITDGASTARAGAGDSSDSRERRTVTPGARSATVEGPSTGGSGDEGGDDATLTTAVRPARRSAAGRVERWICAPGTATSKAENWSRVYDPDDEVDDEDIDEAAADEFGDEDEPLQRGDIASPWGLTWFHFRNDRPGGKPEHKNAYGPQVLINKLIFAQAATIDFQSFPQRYLLVDPKVDDPLVNVVDPDHPETEDDDPEAEGGTSGLKADPAVVWRLWGKNVGEFQAADPDNFLKPLDRYIKSMAELTDTPQHAFSKASADMPTGEAVRGLDKPKIVKIKDRQARYRPTWVDAYELALRMLGITGVDVDLRWVPASQIDDLNGLQVLQGKRDLGVPSDVLLSEAGYPDEQTGAWLKDAQGDSIEARVGLLVQFGTAAQALAAGVKEGVVDEAGSQAYLSRLVRLMAEGTADPEPGPNALPPPAFREPPPTDPAMAQVEAQAKAAEVDPLRKAQVKAAEVGVEATKVGIDSTRAGIEQTRASTGQTKAATEATREGTRQLRTGGQPAKKATPRKVDSR